MSLMLFEHTKPLAAKTAETIAIFQSTYPQFAFDADLLMPAAGFVTRGKLFRGSVCLTISAALTHAKQPSPAAWSAAVALELAGSAILMQDDVMDNALLRRDEPTLHRFYQQHWQGEERDRVRFGESMAVCMSDVLFFLATQQLSTADASETVRVRLLSAMSEQIATLAMAQAEELRLSAVDLNDPSVTNTAITKILIGKTARYTAVWPLIFAGILAAVDDATMQTLTEFGETMGMVFQLSDDRLGLFGDPAITGKDADGDAKTAKKTFYALFAREKLKGDAAKRFTQLYGKPTISTHELLELQALLKREGIYQMVEEQIQQEVQKGKRLLENLRDYPTAQAILSETIEFLAARER